MHWNGERVKWKAGFVDVNLIVALKLPVDLNAVERKLALILSIKINTKCTHFYDYLIWYSYIDYELLLHIKENQDLNSTCSSNVCINNIDCCSLNPSIRWLTLYYSIVLFCIELICLNGGVGCDTRWLVCLYWEVIGREYIIFVILKHTYWQ